MLAAEGGEQFRVTALLGQQRAHHRHGVAAQQVGAEVTQDREGAAAGRPRLNGQPVDPQRVDDRDGQAGLAAEPAAHGRDCRTGGGCH
jgi:hypothetical protein